jgi:hypothetical protein
MNYRISKHKNQAKWRSNLEVEALCCIVGVNVYMLSSVIVGHCCSVYLIVCSSHTHGYKKLSNILLCGMFPAQLFYTKNSLFLVMKCQKVKSKFSLTLNFNKSVHFLLCLNLKHLHFTNKVTHFCKCMQLFNNVLKFWKCMGINLINVLLTHF